MSTLLYPIIESPGARATDYLNQATNNFSEGSIALLPNNHPQTRDLPSTISWKWSENNSFSIPSIDFNNVDECFLFFATERCLATQMEGLLLLLQDSDSLELGRVISLISGDFLKNYADEYSVWLDGLAHFSDVFCFTQRSNDNSSSLKKLIDRYQTLRYPLECYTLSQKSNPWSRILSTSARRVTHIFDSPDLLEEEDTPENDPFLKRLTNGNRERPMIPPSLD